jgi:hypothetical protein
VHRKKTNLQILQVEYDVSKRDVTLTIVSGRLSFTMAMMMD